jgi:transcriptional regulator with XRE-family HTH domain
MSSFGQRLAQLLKERGMTRAGLALKSERSAGYISLLIGGRRPPPSSEIIEDYAKALELTEDEKLSLIRLADEERLAREEGFVDKSRRIESNTKEDSVMSEKNNDGLICLHEMFNTEELNSWIVRSKENVRIMDTWMVNPTNFRSVLLEAWEKNRNNSEFTIRILLLDPDSEVAKLRSIDMWLFEENIDVNFVSNMVRFNLWQISLMQKEVKIIQVRLYKYLPSFSLYGTEENALIGFYMHGTQSDVTPNIEAQLRKDGETTTMGEWVSREFEILWDSAEENIDLNKVPSPTFARS